MKVARVFVQWMLEWRESLYILIGKVLLSRGADAWPVFVACSMHWVRSCDLVAMVRNVFVPSWTGENVLSTFAFPVVAQVSYLYSTGVYYRCEN